VRKTNNQESCDTFSWRRSRQYGRGKERVRQEKKGKKEFDRGESRTMSGESQVTRRLARWGHCTLQRKGGVQMTAEERGRADGKKSVP